ncbi:L-glutamine-phosphate cytidylyltransferase [Azospirillaceae bacterium]
MTIINAKQAIILAAGRGSRMGSLTAEQPKCLTPFLGKTLLDWQIDSLTDAGLNKLTVLRGYRKELLISSRFNTIDNDDWSKTNMVATLRCAAHVLSQDSTVVSYSDIVYHPNHIRALSACDGDIAITYDRLWEKLWSIRFSNPLSDAETFLQKDGRLVTIGEKTNSFADVQGQYMGLLKITPRGWESIETLLGACSSEEIARLDMTSLLRRLLSANIAIHCVPVDGKWCEVDSASDVDLYLEQLNKAEAEKTRWDHDWRS